MGVYPSYYDRCKNELSSVTNERQLNETLRNLRRNDVTDYSREVVKGVVKIKYIVNYDSSSAGYGWVRGAVAWNIHYFDVDTGYLLGNNEEAAAAKLNAKGIVLYDQGSYSGAHTQFQRAYDTSQVKSNYKIYEINKNNAKNEVYALKLNSQGNTFFNQGKYGEAQIKYQEAYDKSQVSREYDKYKDNRDKAKIELDAINLNSQGNILFNQGRYSESKIKYQAAFDKSRIEANKSKYAACIVRSNVELEAIGLKQQGDQEYNAGSYERAKVKYQAAFDKSRVSVNKANYADCRNNASEIVGVFADFTLMLSTSDFCSLTLRDLSRRFEKVMDVAENGRHAAIVNRFHVVSLRKARKEMSSQLESTSREDIDDLIAAIMSLIETEIAVLKYLDIADQELEQELEALEEKLSALEDEFEQSNDGNVLVEIESIALRVDELVEEVEDKALERLGRQTQLERG